MPNLRAFLAIPLPVEITAEVGRLQRHLAADLADIRWVKPAGLHLTLKFFAELPEESLEKIEQIMLSVGRLFPPFPIGISGLGTFPAPARARVFWLGVQGNSILYRLQQTFDERFARIGFARDARPYTPHLTLGRSRQALCVAETLLGRYQQGTGGRWVAERVVLYQSRLDPAGAIHRPLRSVPLTGPAPPGTFSPTI